MGEVFFGVSRRLIAGQLFFVRHPGAGRKRSSTAERLVIQ
jgi:hypothetical protein